MLSWLAELRSHCCIPLHILVCYSLTFGPESHPDLCQGHTLCHSQRTLDNTVKGPVIILNLSSVIAFLTGVIQTLYTNGASSIERDKVKEGKRQVTKLRAPY